MSILINLLNILIVYFYLPPENAGLPQLVSDKTVLLVLNAIVLIAALGRLIDAVTDPAIAIYSDRSRHKRGRRIPLMRWGALPTALFSVLLFVPPMQHESGWNILWLIGIQAVLYVALTAYVTPAFALVADLGRTAEERLDLTTWTTVAWAGGIVVAASTPFLADVIGSPTIEPLRAWQISVGIVATIAGIAMLIPTFVIDEPKWARSEPSAVPIREAARTVTSNEFFRFYLAADFAYFCGLMIIQTGLLYYVTVLLELDEALSAPLLGAMVVVAMFLYPVVNRVAKTHSAKSMVIVGFAWSAFDFVGIVFLGKFPAPAIVQGIGLIVLFAVPFAILSVIPAWILSDIAEHSALTTGDATTGMFFAARTFLQKMSQTVGVMLFAVLTSFGRDIGDDLGIRLSGLAGVVLYGTAAILFSRYDETKLRTELATAANSLPNSQQHDEMRPT